MHDFAVKMFSQSSSRAIADMGNLVSVVLFCGLGLLMSISVIVLDKYTPGEWF
jgi:hypothetical protein